MAAETAWLGLMWELWRLELGLLQGGAQALADAGRGEWSAAVGRLVKGQAGLGGAAAGDGGGGCGGVAGGGGEGRVAALHTLACLAEGHYSSLALPPGSSSSKKKKKAGGSSSNAAPPQGMDPVQATSALRLVRPSDPACLPAVAQQSARQPGRRGGPS